VGTSRHWHISRGAATRILDNDGNVPPLWGSVLWCRRSHGLRHGLQIYRRSAAQL